VLISLLLVLFTAMDLWPSWGPTHFRYTYCDPERTVLSFGLPLALFVYDPSMEKLIAGPELLLLVPLQVLMAPIIVVVSEWRCRRWRRHEA
jgi:hypothetical protein